MFIKVTGTTMCISFIIFYLAASKQKCD